MTDKQKQDIKPYVNNIDREEAIILIDSYSRHIVKLMKIKKIKNPNTKITKIWNEEMTNWKNLIGVINLLKKSPIKKSDGKIISVDIMLIIREYSNKIIETFSNSSSELSIAEEELEQIWGRVNTITNDPIYNQIITEHISLEDSAAFAAVVIREFIACSPNGLYISDEPNKVKFLSKIRDPKYLEDLLLEAKTKSFSGKKESPKKTNSPINIDHLPEPCPYKFIKGKNAGTTCSGTPQKSCVYCSKHKKYEGVGQVTKKNLPKPKKVSPKKPVSPNKILVRNKEIDKFWHPESRMVFESAINRVVIGSHIPTIHPVNMILLRVSRNTQSYLQTVKNGLLF